MGRSLRISFAIVVSCCWIGLSFPVPAKDYLYVPCVNNLQVIDCDTDTIVKTITYTDYVMHGVPSPDGKRFYMNSFRRIYEVDTQTNQIANVHEFWTDLNRVTVSDLAVSQDGKLLYISALIVKKKLNVPRLNVLPPQLWVYDVRKKSVVKSFEIPPKTLAVLNPPEDPNSLILFSQDVLKLDLQSGKFTKILGGLHPEEGKPALNYEGGWWKWTPGSNGMVSIHAYDPGDWSLFFMLVDRKGNVRVQKSEYPIILYDTAVSPDGKYLYGVLEDLYKFDLNTGKVLASDMVARGTCYGVTVTSDGRKLYAGPSGPDLSVYDAATLKYMGMIQLKADGVPGTVISK